MNESALVARYGIVAATAVVSFVSAFLPPVNVEVYLLGVAALAPVASLPWVLLSASLGQVAGKSLFYLAGRGLVKLPLGRQQGRIEQWRGRLEGSRRSVDLLLFASASWGLPPFLVTPYLAGFFKVSFLRFLLWGILGRFLRFAAVMLFPLGIKLLAR